MTMDILLRLTDNRNAIFIIRLFMFCKNQRTQTVVKSSGIFFFIDRLMILIAGDNRSHLLIDFICLIYLKDDSFHTTGKTIVKISRICAAKMNPQKRNVSLGIIGMVDMTVKKSNLSFLYQVCSSFR